MAKRLKRGDRVEWETSQGRTRGQVVRKQVSRTNIKRHAVAATKRDPQYIVQSAKSGKRAAHKAGALRRAAK